MNYWLTNALHGIAFQLLKIGLDLTFDMHHMFLKHLMEAMFDNRDQLIGRSKHLGTVRMFEIF